MDKGMESIYSNRVRAGKRRTYFFDVRKTKGEDFYITLTESTRRFNGQGYNRHKIFLYKEDFNRFLQGLQDAIDHVKNDLLPEYDYEQFDRRQEEWEQMQEAEEGQENTPETEDKSEESGDSDESEDSPASDSVESEEDIDW